ncbi:hypothetical protein [Niallia circulans]|uniref:hypothetical protein n=1 Tax=Niallia circulans TaxID=1397 RepID=UPI00201E55F9|nr:hypothetical protein [Niallia circulans]
MSNYFKIPDASDDITEFLLTDEFLEKCPNCNGFGFTSEYGQCKSCSGTGTIDEIEI